MDSGTATTGPVYGGEGDPAIISAVPVTVEVGSSISLSLNKAAIAIEDVDATKVYTDTLTATIATNAMSYTLSIKANGEDADLHISEGTETIDAIEGTSALAAGTSAWGYKTDAGTTYTGLTTSNEVLSTSQASTEITFGVATSATQKSGTYTGSVTFTATAL